MSNAQIKVDAAAATGASNDRGQARRKADPNEILVTVRVLLPLLSA